MQCCLVTALHRRAVTGSRAHDLLITCSTPNPLRCHVNPLTVLTIFTHADGSRGGKVFTGVCLSVCLSVLPHDISKTDAARITKLDTEMFHHESCKSIYFVVKGQGHDAQKTVPARALALL